VSICPRCSSTVGAVSIKVGVVKVGTHRCSCGKVWRDMSLMGELSHHDAIVELDRLKSRYALDQPSYARYAIAFLQSKISAHDREVLDNDAALRKRRLDCWEKKFLRESLGEGYYD